MKVQIRKNSKGWYIVRSQTGKLAASRDRALLRKIAVKAGWEIVSAWS